MYSLKKYAEYALPTLLMERQHRHCFLSAHFPELAGPGAELTFPSFSLSVIAAWCRARKIKPFSIYTWHNKNGIGRTELVASNNYRSPCSLHFPHSPSASVEWFDHHKSWTWIVEYFDFYSVDIYWFWQLQMLYSKLTKLKSVWTTTFSMLEVDTWWFW